MKDINIEIFVYNGDQNIYIENQSFILESLNLKTRIINQGNTKGQLYIETILESNGILSYDHYLRVKIDDHFKLNDFCQSLELSCI